MAKRKQKRNEHWEFVRKTFRQVNLARSFAAVSNRSGYVNFNTAATRMKEDARQRRHLFLRKKMIEETFICKTLGMDRLGMCIRHPKQLIYKFPRLGSKVDNNISMVYICRICKSEIMQEGGVPVRRHRPAMVNVIGEVQELQTDKKWNKRDSAMKRKQALDASGRSYESRGEYKRKQALDASGRSYESRGEYKRKQALDASGRSFESRGEYGPDSDANLTHDEWTKLVRLRILQVRTWEDRFAIMNHPIFCRYFKMLKYGVSTNAVMFRVEADGYDPSIIELVPNKSLEVQLDELGQEALENLRSKGIIPIQSVQNKNDSDEESYSECLDGPSEANIPETMQRLYSVFRRWRSNQIFAISALLDENEHAREEDNSRSHNIRITTQLDTNEIERGVIDNPIYSLVKENGDEIQKKQQRVTKINIQESLRLIQTNAMQLEARAGFGQDGSSSGLYSTTEGSQSEGGRRSSSSQQRKPQNQQLSIPEEEQYFSKAMSVLEREHCSNHQLHSSSKQKVIDQAVRENFSPSQKETSKILNKFGREQLSSRTLDDSNRELRRSQRSLKALEIEHRGSQRTSRSLEKSSREQRRSQKSLRSLEKFGRKQSNSRRNLRMDDSGHKLQQDRKLPEIMVSKFTNSDSVPLANKKSTSRTPAPQPVTNGSIIHDEYEGDQKTNGVIVATTKDEDDRIKTSRWESSDVKQKKRTTETSAESYLVSINSEKELQSKMVKSDTQSSIERAKLSIDRPISSSRSPTTTKRTNKKKIEDHMYNPVDSELFEQARSKLRISGDSNIFSDSPPVKEVIIHADVYDGNNGLYSDQSELETPLKDSGDSVPKYDFKPGGDSGDELIVGDAIGQPSVLIHNNDETIPNSIANISIDDHANAAEMEYLHLLVQSNGVKVNATITSDESEDNYLDDLRKSQVDLKDAQRMAFLRNEKIHNLRHELKRKENTINSLLRQELKRKDIIISALRRQIKNMNDSSHRKRRDKPARKQHTSKVKYDSNSFEDNSNTRDKIKSPQNDNNFRESAVGSNLNYDQKQNTLDSTEDNGDQGEGGMRSNRARRRRNYNRRNRKYARRGRRPLYAIVDVQKDQETTLDEEDTTEKTKESDAIERVDYEEVLRDSFQRLRRMDSDEQDQESYDFEWNSAQFSISSRGSDDDNHGGADGGETTKGEDYLLETVGGREEERGIDTDEK